MDAEHPDRLEIGWDDLQSQDTTDYVNQMRAAKSVPLVRNVGQAPAPGAGAWYRGQVVQMTLAGLVGGLLAWGLIELFTSPDRSSETEGEATIRNVMFTVVIGFAIGVVLASWEGVQARSWAKVGNSLKWAAPVLLGTTLVGGLIVNQIYRSWMESIYESAIRQAQLENWTELQFYEYITTQNHLPRGVAWALVGLSIGLGLGLASRQKQRVLNGAIGGLVGGFLGGVLFDFFTSGPAARAIGLALTGLAIGLAIGLVEVARRQHWIEIASGGMAGKQFIIYSQRTSVGASPENDVTLIKDPGIAPKHAELVAGPRGLAVTSLDPMHPTLVNGQPVAQHDLADGDVLQLGTTVLKYRTKSDQQPVTGPIVG